MSRDPYEAVLPRAVAAIRAAAALAAKDIKFHSSVDSSAAARFESAGKELLDLANALLVQSTPATGSEVLAYGETAASSDGSWKRVSDMLDVVFEKADLAMDEARAPAKAASEFTYLNESADAANLGVVAEKPQTHFKVPVDNSDSAPFRPKLTAKPHAQTPLADCLKLVDDGHVPPHYPQPYHDEIAASEYPKSVYEACEPQPSQDWAQTTATWVDSVESLQAMIADLRGATEIAVDLEHHDLHSYYGITCLMQVSNRTQDWLVDTLALRDDLSVLNEIFADPRIVKVFHGANMDIIWLQRDLGLYVVSLFDTYHASRALGLAKFSLAYLLETFAKFRTSKKYQLADWRIRPLPQVMHDYARSDTHFLLNIYDQLRNKLLEPQPGTKNGIGAESGSGSGISRVAEVLENSRKVAARRFEYVKFRPPTGYHSGFFNAESGSPDSFISSYNIPASKHALVKAVYAWRDELARDLDESPRYVMPNRVITSLCSLAAPITEAAVTACFSSYSKILREKLHVLTTLVQDAYAEMAELDHLDSTALPDDMSRVSATEITPASAEEIEEIFSLVLERSRALYEDVSASAAGPLQSRIFPASALPADNAFSVKVSATDSATPQVVSSSEVSDRLQTVGAISFAPVHATSSVFEKPEATDNTAESAAEQSATVEEAVPEPKEEPKEEIVTLMPKNRVHHQKKASSQEPESAFDYSASEAKLLVKPEHVKSRSKKRSYQTFGKADEGPQGFKGRKLAPQGKTTSFIKKSK